MATIFARVFVVSAISIVGLLGMMAVGEGLGLTPVEQIRQIIGALYGIFIGMCAAIAAGTMD